MLVNCNHLPHFQEGGQGVSQQLSTCQFNFNNCKVMESVMNLLFRIAVLSDAQHGLAPKRSCLTNLLLTELWVTQCMDAREPVDVVFLDFLFARSCCFLHDAPGLC